MTFFHSSNSTQIIFNSNFRINQNNIKHIQQKTFSIKIINSKIMTKNMKSSLNATFFQISIWFWRVVSVWMKNKKDFQLFSQTICPTKSDKDYVIIKFGAKFSKGLKVKINSINCIRDPLIQQLVIVSCFTEKWFSTYGVLEVSVHFSICYLSSPGKLGEIKASASWAYGTSHVSESWHHCLV